MMFHNNYFTFFFFFFFFFFFLLLLYLRGVFFINFLKKIFLKKGIQFLKNQNIYSCFNRETNNIKFILLYFFIIFRVLYDVFIYMYIYILCLLYFVLFYFYFYFFVKIF